MSKVTYLLGAGASANALPTIANFEKEILALSDKIGHAIGNIGISSQYNITNFKNASNRLWDLYQACQEHKTVDTYAKMLFLTNQHDKYREAKCSIILFFELYKFYRQKIDKRYDAFFASIMKKEHPRLPKEIKIVSWNYDYEFEKAFMKYSSTPSDNIHKIYSELNVIHKNINSTGSLKNSFGILKINGTIGFYNDDRQLTLGLNCHNLSFDEKDYSTLDRFLSEFEKFSNPANGYEPAISFSWESDEATKKITDELYNAVNSTDALVIIGYSFPTFNRLLDKELLEYVTSFSSIYIQDPEYYSVREKVERFRKDWEDVAIHEERLNDEFYIPFEL